MNGVPLFHHHLEISGVRSSCDFTNTIDISDMRVHTFSTFTQIYWVNTLLRKTEKEKAVDKYKCSIKISHECNYITKELLVKVKILKKTQRVYNIINLWCMWHLIAIVRQLYKVEKGKLVKGKKIYLHCWSSWFD